MTAFSYNIKEGKDKEISIPRNYEDLINPKYRGEIIMSNPSSSGTGFFDCFSMDSINGRRESLGIYG